MNILRDTLSTQTKGSQTAKYMAAIAIISSLAIYASDTTLSSTFVQNVLLVIVYILVALTLGGLLAKGSKLRATLYVLPTIVFVFLSYYDAYIPHGFNVLLLTILLMISVLPDRDKIDTFIYYRRFVIISSLVGILCALCYQLGLSFLYREVPYYTGRTIYIDFFVSYFCMQNGIPRLCGLFNEPGYLGTIAALLICADGMNFKHKGNWVLFVAGFLSFSLAFFLLVSFYFVAKSFRSAKSVIIALFALFILYLLISYAPLPDGVQHIIERLQFRDGDIAGDNRSNDVLDYAVVSMLSSKNYMWGYGYGYASDLTTMVLSYKSYILNFGLAGFALSFGTLLFAALKDVGKNVPLLLFVICFFISVYQRPNIFCLPYYVILLGGIQYMRSVKKYATE